MRIPTVRIRNPKTGKVMTVNQYEWAMDLGRGRFRGWTLDGGATHVKNTEKEVEAAIKSTTPEAFEQPMHIINDDVKKEVVSDESGTKETETFTDRGGNTKPRRRPGRPSGSKNK